MSLMVTLSLFNMLATGMTPAYPNAQPQEKDGNS